LALKLSAEKILVQDERPSDSRPSMQSLQVVNERYAFGKLEEIAEAAKSCPLCRLVSRSLPSHLPDEARGAFYHLMWEIDGRLLDKDSKRTRRLRIRWSQPSLEPYESYLVLAATAIYDHSDVDYRGLLNDETEFVGRRVGRTENKRNLIREFLRLCERHYDERCTQKLGIEDEFHETLMEPYFGVIDIENDQLVPLPFAERGDVLSFESYTAVSYVWGNDEGHRQQMTTTANIQSRRKSGGLASIIPELPKALQEAIRLVHALEIRYIWIDALCIVQPNYVLALELDI
jgi:hypothetical protein